MSLKGKNILVIEDDKDIRDLIAFNIKNEGFHSIEAKNGEKGLEKVREKTPDLILLDLMLPGIQGLDVCRIIKSDKTTKNIPIIPTKLKNIIATIAYCRLPVKARFIDITPGTSQAVDFPANA